MNKLLRVLAWIGVLSSLFGICFMAYHILAGVNYQVVLVQIFPPTFGLAAWSIWCLLNYKNKPEPEPVVEEEPKPEPTWFQIYINSPYK